MSKTIVITGGSGKFGRALVKHFLATGNVVVTTCFSEASVDSLTSEHVHSINRRLHVIRLDHTHADQAHELVESLQQRGLQPDSLVNNARSLKYLSIRNDGRTHRDDFIGELLMDVVVPYELTMALAHGFETSLKRVVNIGSMYGQVAANPTLYVDPVRQSPIQYGVSKAALAHLTKELAVRLSSSGIVVNCVAYGGVEGRADEAFKGRYGRLCPAGRMLREDEIPGPVAWLLSEGCSGMTGHTLIVDGGWSVW